MNYHPSLYTPLVDNFNTTLGLVCNKTFPLRNKKYTVSHMYLYLHMYVRVESQFTLMENVILNFVSLKRML